LAGALGLSIAFARQDGVAWEADRELRAAVSGFHPLERDGDTTFAWTTRAASFSLEGVRRDAPWTCTVRLRGGRPDGVPQPLVQLGADGLVATTLTATNAYQDVQVPVPPQPGRTGLRLTIAAEPVMVPGADDPRALGVQVDRVACRPDGDGVSLAPGRALLAAAASAGAFGGAAVLLGLGPAGALATTTGLALAQAVPLAEGIGPYSSHPGLVMRLAIAVSTMLALAGLLARGRRRPLHPAAAFAVTFAAGAMLLELYALLHPAKPLVDALFHAHRLEWVLDGRYYFTQPMPDGVRFPYAIALYVVAAPWTWLATDKVVLLRVVVAVARALSAVVLYSAVRRSGGDRATAAVSSALVYLVPLPYISIGNANLTFVFGQSAAMIALAAAVAWHGRRRWLVKGAGLFGLAAIAFLSHVGIFPALLAALLAFGALTWWVEPGQRRFAVVLLAATVCAAAFSVVAYYGRFGEAFQTLERVRARASSAVVADAASGGGDAAQAPAATRPPGSSLPARIANAGRIGVRAFGWPLVLLAVAGAWHAWRCRARDRVVLATAATVAAGVALLSTAVMAPVEPRFQRYNDEFIDRVSYATMPAIVWMAARGVSWWWGAGVVPRLAVLALLAISGALAAGQWLAWLS
ncbi:MAG: hypothetical protein MUF60_09485, partial [Vicinamibacterales bacterium]|nr:hypothetical protein [Vicinamibacterales bacterium]